MKREELKAWAKSRIKGLENLNSFLKFIWEKKLIILLAVLVIFVLATFWSYVKALLIMALFTALGIASLYYMKFIRFPLGVELNTLGIVIIGKLYGAFPAIIVGLITLFIAELITERLTHSTSISFLGIIIIGLIIPLFPESWSITKIGIILAIIYDAIIIPLYIMFGSSIARSGTFLATHIIFNIWVFTFIAPNVYRIFG